MSAPDEPAIKVVGWGLLPLPGEKKRRRKAYTEAQEMLRIAEECERREQEERTEKDQ